MSEVTGGEVTSWILLGIRCKCCWGGGGTLKYVWRRTEKRVTKEIKTLYSWSSRGGAVVNESD